jgi:hypothetical protein
MRKLLFSAMFVCMALSHAQSQYWRSIGRGTIGPTLVTTLFGDTVLDRLLAGGSFHYFMNETDTVAAKGQAAWNGERWDSLAHPMTSVGGPAYWFVRFGGDLYLCGQFSFESTSSPGQGNSGIAKLNAEEQRWEDLGCPNPSMNGMSTIVPRDPGAVLYATGYSGSICGYPKASVFRYDGEMFHEWEPFSHIPQNDNNYVGSVFDFRGMTYMTCAMPNPLGTGYTTFLRWNGSNWEHVPGWGNTPAIIKDISIRNDTLYVAGTLRMAQGAPGNGVACFDGTAWNNMGGGLWLTPAPNFVSAVVLQWYRDELYVSGQFDRAGGIAAGYLAKWNGRQWCSLPGHFTVGNGSPTWVYDMAVWRDSLYVGGEFTSIDGEPIRHVAQWLGGDAVVECSEPVGVQEITPPTFTLYPNPTNGLLHVEAQGMRPRAWRLTDAVGREVLHGTAVLGNFVVDLSGLGNGLYHFVLEDAQGASYARTVVRE